MKRALSMLLAAVTVMVLFAGCGSTPAENVEPSAPEVTPGEPTPDATPAPVLSDKLQQVYDLGIADVGHICNNHNAPSFFCIIAPVSHNVHCFKFRFIATLER